MCTYIHVYVIVYMHKVTRSHTFKSKKHVNALCMRRFYNVYHHAEWQHSNDWRCTNYHLFAAMSFGIGSDLQRSHCKHWTYPWKIILCSVLSRLTCIHVFLWSLFITHSKLATCWLDCGAIHMMGWLKFSDRCLNSSLLFVKLRHTYHVHPLWLGGF